MRREANSVMGLVFMAVYLMLGIFLIVNPEPSIKIMCGVIGGVLGVIGVVRIINYFRLDRYEAMLRKELAMGCFMLLLAFFVIMKADVVASFIPIALGVVLVFEAMSLAQAALDLKRLDMKGWAIDLAAAGIVLVMGALILFDPFTTAKMLVRFIGISFLVEGIATVVSMFLLRSYKKTYKKLEIAEVESK